MDAKTVFIGILGAIGLGILLYRRAPAQTPTPIEPVSPEPAPGTEPIIRIPPPQPTPSVGLTPERIANPPWPATKIWGNIRVELVKAVDTDWRITLRLYSSGDITATYRGLTLEQSVRLSWSAANTPVGPQNIIRVADSNYPVYASDFTLDVQGYGTPFILIIPGDKGFDGKVLITRIVSPGQYAGRLQYNP